MRSRSLAKGGAKVFLVGSFECFVLRKLAHHGKSGESWLSGISAKYVVSPKPHVVDAPFFFYIMRHSAVSRRGLCGSSCAFASPLLALSMMAFLLWSCVAQVRDAKCLHAHVADALMRGRHVNAIGRATLELLEARGVRTDGGDRCSEQCNYRVEETADSWR